MKYPKLKCEDKKNTKVCSVTIQKMKAMRKEKYTYNEIADKFKIAQRTAWIHTAPTKLVANSKKKRAQALLLEHNEKYANNPKYRKKVKLSTRSSLKRRGEIDPRFREDFLAYKRESRMKKSKELRAKHPTWSYNCAYSRHENTTIVVRCKNKSGNCKCPCHKKFK